jgi:membrane-associated phospholipid phosphatase
MSDDRTAVSVFNLVDTYIIFINTAIVSFYLWKQPMFVWAYVGALILNEGIVRVLKPVLKSPRPEMPDGVADDSHRYGMPSGHALHIAFTLVYVCLVKPSWPIVYIVGLFGAVALYERYLQNYHTLSQLAVGGMLGVGIALAVVWAVRAWLRRQLFEKTW